MNTTYEEWARDNARLIQHPKTRSVARQAFNFKAHECDALEQQVIDRDRLIEALMEDLHLAEMREKSLFSTLTDLSELEKALSE